MTNQHTSLSVGRSGEGEGASAEADRAVVNGAASVSAVPASVPSANRAADFDWHIFGDWRDLRAAIESASPLWQEASASERSKLWDFAQSIIAEYAPMKARCCECKIIIPARDAYRCADCHSHCCQACIRPHFGPNHRSHA